MNHQNNAFETYAACKKVCDTSNKKMHTTDPNNTTESTPKTQAGRVVVHKFDIKNADIRSFEAALRDACGLSVKQAKRLLAGGWRELTRDERNRDMTQLDEIATKLHQITERLNAERKYLS